MCGITNIGSEVAEKLEQAIKSGTASDKKAAHESASKTRLYAVAALAVSLFLAILGVALCATGVSAGFGIFLILVSSAAFYAGYNVYKTLSNVKDMIENVQKYRPQLPAPVLQQQPPAPPPPPGGVGLLANMAGMVGLGGGNNNVAPAVPQPVVPQITPGPNWSIIKQDLKAGTFLFDWAIDSKVENIAYRDVN